VGGGSTGIAGAAAAAAVGPCFQLDVKAAKQAVIKVNDTQFCTQGTVMVDFIYTVCKLQASSMC
jgi:hypothetical protein